MTGPRLLYTYLLSACALAACASTPQTVHQSSGEALKAAISTLDLAEVTATNAVKAGLVSAENVAVIHHLETPCAVGVIPTIATVDNCPLATIKYLANQAYQATDTTSFPQLTSQLLGLANQLTGLSKATPSS